MKVPTTMRMKLRLVAIALLLSSFASLMARPVLTLSTFDGRLLYRTGDNVQFDVRMVGNDSADSAMVEYEVVEVLDGGLLRRQELSLTPDGDGSQGRFSFMPAKAGCYLTRVICVEPCPGPIEEVKFSVVQSPDVHTVDNRFGLFLHNAYRPDISNKIGWQQIVYLGVKWLHLAAIWKGDAKTEELVNFLLDEGFNISAYFWMKPESCPQAYSAARRAFYDSHNIRPIPDAEVYAGAFAETVSTLRGKVKQWIIFDETDASWASTSDVNVRKKVMHDYVQLMKAAYIAGKEADPECMIMSCGLAWVYEGDVFLREFLGQGGGNYTDAIVLNFYGEARRGRRLETALPAEIQNIKRMQEEFGLNKPVLIGGTGASLDVLERGRDLSSDLIQEVDQSASVAKHGIVSLSTGAESFFVYAYGTRDEGNSRNYGLNDLPNFSPRLAYFAYANLTRLLRNTVFESQSEPVKGVKVYTFRESSGKKVVVAWSIDGESRMIDFNVSGPVEMVNLLGAVEFLQPFAGKITAAISDKPIYIRGNFPSKTVQMSTSSFSLESEGIFRAGGGAITVSLAETAAYDRVDMSVEPSAYFEVSPAKLTLQQGQDGEFMLLPTRALKGNNYPLTIKLYAPGTDQLCGTVSCSQVVLNNPLTIRMVPKGSQGSDPSLTVFLKNNSLDDVQGDLVVEGPGASAVPKTVSLSAASKTLIRLNLDRSKMSGGVNNYGVTMFIEDKPVSKCQGSFEFTRCPRFTPSGLGNWPFPRQMTLNSRKQIKNISDWKGPDDLSADVGFCWDERNLYFRISVKDNVFFQPFTDSDIWKGDSIQIAIDPAYGFGDHPVLKPDGLRYQLNNKTDFWEIGLAETTAGPIVYRWKGADPGEVFAARLETESDKKNITYQVAIPWTEISSSLVPQKGHTFSISVAINDNDGSGYRGTMESHGGINGVKDKTLFGDFTLTMEDIPQQLDATDANLVINSSFEMAPQRGEIIAGWKAAPSEHTGAKAIIRRDTTQSYHGINSLLLGNRAEKGLVVVTLAEPIVVKPGEEYALSGWIKAEMDAFVPKNTNEKSINMAYLVLQTYTENGDFGMAEETSPIITKSKSAWTPVQLKSFTVPPDSESLTVYCVVNGGYLQAWFDKILLKKVN